jgi:hypothetical protein
MRLASCRLRAIAALLLLAYLMAGAQLLPAALTVLAEFDAEHELVVAHTAAGYEVILAHEEDSPTPEPCQHCHGLGRLLANLSALDGHGDHSCRLAILEVAAGSDRAKKFGASNSLQTVFVAVQPLPWAIVRERFCQVASRDVHRAGRPLTALLCRQSASVQLQV